MKTLCSVLGGFAAVFVENTHPTDKVVFAEKGGLVLLRARPLEGLNLAFDPRKKKPVAVASLPVAACRITGAEI